MPVIMGSSMPVTPRVGIAAATIIITVIVISSPRVSPRPSSLQHNFHIT